MLPFSLAIGTTHHFAPAAASALDFLQTAVPMGCWAVAAFEGGRAVHREVRDAAYGVGAGRAHRWAASLGRRLAASGAPRVAPDARTVPALRSARIASRPPIGAYVAIPLHREDGTLSGVLCGFDPAPRTDALLACAPVLELVAALLGRVLDAERARSEHARALERARSLAQHDPLTGILNRYGWQELLLREAERPGRAGETGAIFVIDLDDLKRVNDAEGHAAGDALLTRAAAALAGAVRAGDVVARLGGDEFAVLAVGASAGAAADILARLRATFDAPGLRASVGCALVDEAGGHRAALAAADSAMYAEKAARRTGRLRLVA